MAAGLVGYLGYDMVRLMEVLPDDNPDVIGIPDAVFMRPTVMAVFDNIDDMVTHTLPLDQINDAFDLMHRGESIRSVVIF